MRRAITAFVSLAIAALPVLAWSQQPLSRDEIVAAFVGKTATFPSGARATYAADGTYSYNTPTKNTLRLSGGGIVSGRYRVYNGKICYRLNGETRRKCDTILKQNGSYVVVAPNGQSYPVELSSTAHP